MEWDQEEDGIAASADADDGAPAGAGAESKAGGAAEAEPSVLDDDALDDAIFDDDSFEADPFEADPDVAHPDDDPADAGPAEGGSDAPAALRRLRELTARHGTASLVIAAAVALVLVLGCFALVYGVVLSGVTVEKDAPDDASEALQPVENHELPHLALRVTDISATEYPVVSVTLALSPDDGGAVPALDASSFSIAARDADGAEVEASIEGVEAAGSDAVRVLCRLGEAAPGTEQRIDLTLDPSCGYRGGVTPGFIVPGEPTA
ncbi:MULTISPECIES: hypothetical protein [Enorma]|uniref:hypothetical protein n=1 Tax=Enorma TaxID=1472762 RepID=UPI0003469A72|nr:MULTISPECIES: hypothetical protein [Enorma]